MGIIWYPISVMTIGQRIKRLETQSHLGGNGGDGNLFGDIPSFPCWGAADIQENHYEQILK